MDGYRKRRIDDSVTPLTRTVCHSTVMTDREVQLSDDPNTIIWNTPSP